MKHIDLFSGIGGFALAAQAVWGDDYEPVLFCDNNPFCQAVIKKRVPGIKVWGDIRKLIKDTISHGWKNKYEKKGKCFRKQWNIGSRNGNGIHLLTGGFPCQPFSQAGKRRGKSDDRFLWSEMLECIRLFRPSWVIAENVRGILSIEGGLVFEQVCLDLEAEGYEVWPLIIPACAINTPHRRDRVWIVAHTNSRKRPLGGIPLRMGRFKKQDKDAPNSDSEGLEGWKQLRQGKGEDAPSKESWQQNWLEVATRLCGVDDGLPARFHGLKLSKSRHRIERLKALGNAIVPQVVVEIMKAIKEIDGK